MAPPSLPSSYLFSVLESQMAAVSATGMLIQSAYAAALGANVAPASSNEAPSTGGFEVAYGRFRFAIAQRSQALTCHVACVNGREDLNAIGIISALSLDDLEMQLHRLDLSKLILRDGTPHESESAGLLSRARRKFEEAHLRGEFESAVEALFAKLDALEPL